MTDDAKNEDRITGLSTEELQLAISGLAWKGMPGRIKSDCRKLANRFNREIQQRKKEEKKR